MWQVSLRLEGTGNQSGLGAPECAANGFIGSRRTFWRYLDDRTPALMDVVHSEDRVYAVFNIRPPQLKKGLDSHPWHEATWKMVCDDNGVAVEVPARALDVDPHHHTLIIFANPPRHLLERPGLVNVSISFAGRMGQQVANKAYRDAPLCIAPTMRPFHHLIACTGILPEDVAAVPEWAVYHFLQGFQHLYIYADGNVSTVQKHLQPLVTAGLVTVIDYEWPLSGRRLWWAQQAVQNSCLIRARGRARWVGLHDVDEYYQAMGPGNKTVAQFLHEHSKEENIAAFSVRNHFFGSSNSTSQQQQSDAVGRGLALGRFQHRAEAAMERGRHKLLANPHSISYARVHTVTAGGRVVWLNASTEMRLVHYKLPHEWKYHVHDTSMAVSADAVLTILKKLYV